jgi:hypothetical protein
MRCRWAIFHTQHAFASHQIWVIYRNLGCGDVNLGAGVQGCGRVQHSSHPFLQDTQNKSCVATRGLSGLKSKGINFCLQVRYKLAGKIRVPALAALAQRSAFHNTG